VNVKLALGVGCKSMKGNQIALRHRREPLYLAVAHHPLLFLLVHSSKLAVLILKLARQGQRETRKNRNVHLVLPGRLLLLVRCRASRVEKVNFQWMVASCVYLVQKVTTNHKKTNQAAIVLNALQGGVRMKKVVSHVKICTMSMQMTASLLQNILMTHHDINETGIASHAHVVVHVAAIRLYQRE